MDVTWDIKFELPSRIISEELNVSRYLRGLARKQAIMYIFLH